MARRRRSYKANSDKLLSTAFNNYLAASAKKKKAEARERAKSTREYEKSAARRAKEREAELKKAEREKIKRAKAKERELAAKNRAREVEKRKKARAEASYQKKVDAMTSRLSIELSNKNFLIVDDILDEIAEECLKALITPAKAYKFYVSPREDEFRSRMINAFVEDECRVDRQSMIPESAHPLYSELRNKQEDLKNEIHALSYSEEPITDLKAIAKELATYLGCMALVEKLNHSIDSEIKKQKELEAAKKAEDAWRKKSRDDFIERHRLDCFEEDLRGLIQMAEAENFGGEQLECLDCYKEAKEIKDAYVDDLKERLGAFMGSAYPQV